MIKFLQPQLEQWGFRRNDRSTYFQDQAPLGWWVAQTRLANDDAKFRINLGITIYDPFRTDEGRHAICLSGDLEPNGVGTHFDDTPFWWRYSEHAKVLPIFENCSLPWFRYWSVPRLIRYFQRPAANVTFRFAQSDKAMRPLIDKRAVTRKPPVHLLWLALLFYHKKDYQHSLAHAERWYEEIKNVREGEDVEPQRTRLQLGVLRKALTASGDHPSALEWATTE
jgi:hypothetical protein